ncbi:MULTISPECIES: hypothetical protein [unclassified Chamaesiphon]|nr:MULTISPECIES: hypothetical protein [unclassified Chamaesiphon]
MTLTQVDSSPDYYFQIRVTSRKFPYILSSRSVSISSVVSGYELLMELI